VPISPALKHEYDITNQALMQMLYGPGPVAQHVVGALAGDGQHKVKSVVTMTLVLVRGLYKQTHFPIQLAGHIVHDVAAHVMDIGQQVKQIQYSDHDATLIVSAAMEQAMRMFGVSKGQVRNFIHLVGRQKADQHAQAYHSGVTAAKAGMQQGLQQGQPVPGTGGQSAGPQSGAPAGATAPPNAQGAAPQGPPPPQSGAPPEAPEAEGGDNG
jgi:hypothetical protein